MDNVKINTSKTLTLTIPSDPDSNQVLVTLIHDLGNDVIVSNTAATRVSTGVYQITFGQAASGIYVLNSSGIYKAKFTYSKSGTEYNQYQVFSVYAPYIDSDTFFESYPEYINKFEDVFDKFELKARNIINTYCGQSFDFFPAKTIYVDGNNHDILHLPLPISTLTKVTVNPDMSGQEVIHDSSNSSINKIEKPRQSGNFEASYYIRYKSSSSEYSSAFTGESTGVNNKFSSKSTFKIEGDFGWRYVPSSVEQAAGLLVADFMNDDSEFRRHGIIEVDIDRFTTFKFKGNFYETTGNIDADVLLMDYTLFVMDYII